MSATILDPNYLSNYMNVAHVSTAQEPVLSIEDLLQSHEAMSQKEDADRVLVAEIVNISTDALKPKLYAWAAAGFPDGYQIQVLQLVPPSVCLDGTVRSLVAYFEYCAQMTVTEWLTLVGKKVSGMYFTYTHDGSSKITLCVNRS
jgi:hypothetical protein